MSVTLPVEDIICTERKGTGARPLDRKGELTEANMVYANKSVDDAAVPDDETGK